MRTRQASIGFTLIELLIVVAIIAILAAIAVPNFLEAQVRSKVARAQADMRSLAVALESYMVDYNTYPPWFSHDETNLGRDGRLESFCGRTYRALTTPVAYISRALKDPFVAIGLHVWHNNNDVNEYLDPTLMIAPGFLGLGTRIVSGCDRFLISSYGPDAGDDTASMSVYPYTVIAIVYDPTNGTVSWGDIYRHSGKVPVNFIAGHWPGGGLTHGSDVSDIQGQGDPYAWAQ